MPLQQDLTTLTTASPVVATFDYTDIINGTEIIELNLNYDGSYFLGTKQYIDTNAKIEAGLTADLAPFTSARTATGTAVLQFYINGTTGSHMTFKLQKWDGASATDISSAIDSQDSAVLAGLTVQIPVTTTKFKKGESIRLLISAAGGQEVRFDNTTYPLTLDVAFEVNR